MYLMLKTDMVVFGQKYYWGTPLELVEEVLKPQYLRDNGVIIPPLFLPIKYDYANLCTISKDEVPCIPHQYVSLKITSEEKLLIQLEIADIIYRASVVYIFTNSKNKPMFWAIAENDDFEKSSIIQSPFDIDFVKDFCISENINLKIMHIPDEDKFETYFKMPLTYSGNMDVGDAQRFMIETSYIDY